MKTLNLVGKKLLGISGSGRRRPGFFVEDNELAAQKRYVAVAGRAYCQTVSRNPEEVN